MTARVQIDINNRTLLEFTVMPSCLGLARGMHSQLIEKIIGVGLHCIIIVVLKQKGHYSSFLYTKAWVPVRLPVFVGNPVFSSEEKDLAGFFADSTATR